MKLTAKISQRAYDKLIYARDKSPNEVAMFGLTLEEDPLYVVDFNLIKQEVNTVSADMDTSAVAEFEEKMFFENSISVINCTRFWAHTHPMTGHSSANPSSKDMLSWNDEANNLKNFLVMFIISKSGEMTCKIKVGGESSVPGLSLNLAMQKDIETEIVKDEEYELEISKALIDYYGEVSYALLPQDVLIEHLPDKSIIYPWREEFDKEYDSLVNEEKPIPQYQVSNQHIGFQYNSKKKLTPTLSSIPEILYEINQDINLNTGGKFTLNLWQEKLLERKFDFSKDDINKIEPLINDYAKISRPKTLVSLIQGLMSVNEGLNYNNLTFSSLSDDKKRNVLRTSNMLYKEVEFMVDTFNNYKA